MQNRCLWQSTLSQMCYSACIRGDIWGRARGGRWKWEVSLTSTPDSCSWISKNSCVNGGRFSSFLLIILKHWNTLQLNGFIKFVTIIHSPPWSLINNIDCYKEYLVNISQRGNTCSLHLAIYFANSIDVLFTFLIPGWWNRHGRVVVINCLPSFSASVRFWRMLEKREIQLKSLSSAPRPRLHPSCPLLLQGIALATHEETSGALQDSDIRVNTNLGGMW